MIFFWQENINVSVAKMAISFLISSGFLINFVLRLPVKTTKTIPNPGCSAYILESNG
jgi:hypothetical protein